MKLNEFAFVHDNVFKYLYEGVTGFKDWLEIKTIVEERFTEDYAAGRIFFSNQARDCSFIAAEDSATMAWFNTGLEDISGQRIWSRFVLNKRVEARQRWFGMECMSEKEMVQEVLKTKFFVMGGILLKSFDEGLTFLARVAQEVQKEEWKYKHYQEASINFPILKSYLEHTFWRLKQENKLVYSVDEKSILFNTGLLEKEFLLDVNIACDVREIDVFGVNYTVYENPTLVLESDTVIRKRYGNARPQLAKYFTSFDELIFNPDLEIDLNWRHIFIERKDRIPRELYRDESDLKRIVQRFRGNEEVLKKLTKRNYKMVVPQYYANKIQFLMPVYLGTHFEGMPDFALVLDLEENHGESYFKGTTILTVEMAYQNARLLSRPDIFWLTASLG